MWFFDLSEHRYTKIYGGFYKIIQKFTEEWYFKVQEIVVFCWDFKEAVYKPE